MPETFLFPVGLAQQEGKPPNPKSQGPYFLFLPIGWVLWILQVYDISARRPSGKSQHTDTVAATAWAVLRQHHFPALSPVPSAPQRSVELS